MTQEEMKRRFSHNICFLRKYYRISQRSLAGLLGIGIESLRKLEKGGPFPRAVNCNTLCRLADMFNLSTDAILYADLESSAR